MYISDIVVRLPYEMLYSMLLPLLHYDSWPNIRMTAADVPTTMPWYLCEDIGKGALAILREASSTVLTVDRRLVRWANNELLRFERGELVHGRVIEAQLLLD